MMAPMVEIEEDGEHARGTFCLLCLVTMEVDGKDDAYVLSGKYSNKYVRIDGKWYFEELTGHIEQTAPWEEGWVKVAFTKKTW